MLDRMGKKGLVTIRKGEPLPERGGKARLYYGLTNTGRAALQQAEQTSAMLGALKEIRL
jgi:DNA-binding PadR family transcriptional regulator